MSLKLKLYFWQFAFILLSKALGSFLDFSTTPKQRREIIFHVARIAVLVENEFDSKSSILTSSNFRNVVLGKSINTKNSLLTDISEQISNLTRHIKEMVSNDDFYEEFSENIIKTWETHKVRDVKECNVKISIDNALQCSEERGGFYFLALIFALQPKNFTAEYKRAVYLSGAWIQIVDDYADREKDKNSKNTPFTISKNQSSKEIFKQYKANYKKQIQASINSRYLIVLIEIFSFL